MPRRLCQDNCPENKSQSEEVYHVKYTLLLHAKPVAKKHGSGTISSVRSSLAVVYQPAQQNKNHNPKPKSTEPNQAQGTNNTNAKPCRAETE
jgi:hypothetical protein